MISFRNFCLGEASPTLLCLKQLAWMLTVIYRTRLPLICSHQTQVWRRHATHRARGAQACAALTPAPRGLSQRDRQRKPLRGLSTPQSFTDPRRKQKHPSAPVAKLALKFVPGCPKSRGVRERECAARLEDGWRRRDSKQEFLRVEDP